jgi:hyperosmotically inducible protein
MKTLALTAACVAIMFSVGCSMQANRNASADSLSDDQLKSLVKTRLQSDASISRLGLGVDADAPHSAVELSGVAYTERQRTRAVELAKGVREGIAVHDKIEVKPSQIPRDLFDDDMMKDAKAEAAKMGDEMGSTADDAWIHTKIVTQLIADKDTPERKINVDVMDSIVTLRGNVPTRQAKEQAETIAKGVEGVKKVNNKLLVKG